MKPEESQPDQLLQSLRNERERDDLENTRLNRQPVARENKDSVYAARFWQKQPEGMRSQMIENILKAAEKGCFSSFVDPVALSEKDKEKLSAYRQLAHQMGYEIGSFSFNRDTHTCTAPIEKVPGR